MSQPVLNETPLNVFVIIATTTAHWRDPHSEEGKIVLLEHYAWGKEIKDSGKLLLAGPSDVELTTTGLIDAVGHITGIIMLKVNTREEAEAIAFNDPFHKHQYRVNKVQSLKITMTNDSIYSQLEKTINV